MGNKYGPKKKKLPTLGDGYHIKFLVFLFILSAPILFFYEKKIHHGDHKIVHVEPEELHDIIDKQCVDQDSKCKFWASKEQCALSPSFMRMACPVSCNHCKPTIHVLKSFADEDIVLTTIYGKIRIRPYLDKATTIGSMVLNFAHTPKASNCTGCHFYRSEEPPHGKWGPPYGLFQGSLPGLLYTPPIENTPSDMKRGHVVMIPNSHEFFISLVDQVTWGVSMSVWGEVDEASLHLLDKLVTKLPYKEVKHPKFNKLLRILDERVNFSISYIDRGIVDDFKGSVKA
mmetsp:Transcript_13406/g.23750  ORF Transcript_13406/g.23750 Transcript_13406/m.23750 type:complete len:286 (-) Transcript_13406:248-1105(-)|eukprot:CAMPEP_0175064660 /NCGR_PEP_ID=MMETSP0052_2-20121109/15464_1 /TAXON_ID=51329 ORGANISM="Polytomella parva, Strain SAG 63-3" /NCGR_SAMPLE_ID=MMETSP0052_2 /ASSEMBLY_ACC=CAM_ASM_000194 /LENGTH=285 /DNA_ID=CAMNT_0016331051 /DNA_START=64 /DNA_END=921 /DNA_ORIENTATION=-